MDKTDTNYFSISKMYRPTLCTGRLTLLAYMTSLVARYYGYMQRNGIGLFAFSFSKQTINRGLI